MNMNLIRSKKNSEARIKKDLYAGFAAITKRE